MTKRVSAALLAVLLLIPLGIVPAAASPASPVVLATLVRTQENAAPDYAWAFHGDGVELTAVNQNAPVQIGYMGTARTPIVINNGAVNNNPADGNGWRSVGPMDVDSGITVDTATAFQLRFSTLGHDDIHFSATQKSTGSGPEFFALAYSFSATGPFTAIADSQVAVARLSNDTYSALVPSFTNFPLPASVDNQPVVYLRVYMVNSTLTNRANGNTSINNIRITSGEDNNNGSQPIPPHEWGLPALHIDAPNHPFEMERLQWHNGAMSLRGSDVDFENIPISIRGRGNTTWQNVPEKRPLRLRFHTPRHMPGSAFAHNDWIIINNGPDNTQLRTHMAMDFNRRMNTNMHYVSIAQPVHVYVNGE
ncbi:MAG: CotH kinase family protein, partial [Oscillospiraceae bacterium]|nr:CotH kinase family protein [Oscillospiraceae bacterium]